MSRALLGALILLVVSQPAAAKVPTFPASFQTTTVQTDGAIIYARVGGQGPAVVMLHASPILETCGHPWRRCLRRIIQS